MKNKEYILDKRIKKKLSQGKLLTEKQFHKYKLYHRSTFNYRLKVHISIFKNIWLMFPKDKILYATQELIAYFIFVVTVWFVIPYNVVMEYLHEIQNKKYTYEDYLNLKKNK